MKKRLTALLLCMLIVAATFTACGNGSDKAKSGDALKIAIISSISGVDDNSFNQDNYEGILDFIQYHPDSTVTPIQEPSGDPAAAVQAVGDIVADYDVIVCDGFQFSGISEIANDNPSKKFILVDTYPSDASGNEVSLENVYGMQFKEEEGGFLAGVAASLNTKSGKVAVVNGIAYPSNVNYQFGFMSGVNYSNKHFGTSAEVVELASYAGTDVTGKNIGGNYIGSFSDPATGKVIGEALINEGCDVIFVAAGAAGNGVFTAVKESAADDYVIGVDTDQYDDGVNGDKNIVLTTSLKLMGINDKRVLESIVDGSFKGGNYLLGADSDSVSYVKKSGRNQLSDEDIEKLDKVQGLLKSGTIVPASNSNGLTPDNFTGMDAE